MQGDPSIYEIDPLIKLITFLSEPQKTDVLNKVISVAMQSNHSLYKGDALVELMPHLSEPLKKDILNRIYSIIAGEESDFIKDQLLTKFIPYIAEPQEALTLAEEIIDPTLRSQAFADIAYLLNETERIQILKRAYTITREIRDEEGIASLLAKIMPYLSEHVRVKIFERALTIARNIEEDWVRATILAKLSPSAPENQKDDLIREALSLSRLVKNDLFRDRAITCVLNSLAYNEDPIILAKEITNVFYRAEALCDIASSYPEPRRTEIIQEALTLIMGVDSDWHKAIHLPRIILHLTEPQKSKVTNIAFDIAIKVEDSWDKGQALVELIPFLTEPRKRDTIKEVMTIIENIDDISGDERFTKSLLLAKIMPYLAKPEDALALAKTIEVEFYKSRAFINIIPYISRSSEISTLKEALLLIRNIDDIEIRGVELKDIVQLLTAKSPLFIYPLWVGTLRFNARRTRENLLSDLSALIPITFCLGGQAALEQTADVILNVYEWWPHIPFSD